MFASKNVLWMGLSAALLAHLPVGLVVAGNGSSAVSAEEDVVKAEALGPLNIGMTDSAVEAGLGKKPIKGKAERWEADAAYHQTWHYRDQGVTLGMSSKTSKGPRVLESIEAEQGCRLTTKRGIGIGSPEGAVLAAYGNRYNKEESSPGESIVVGSLENGLIFSLKDGRVERIFIGVAAE